jgi:hypothetical protein
VYQHKEAIGRKMSIIIYGFGEIEKARGENNTEVKCDCQYTDDLRRNV